VYFSLIPTNALVNAYLPKNGGVRSFCLLFLRNYGATAQEKRRAPCYCSTNELVGPSLVSMESESLFLGVANDFLANCLPATATKRTV